MNKNRILFKGSSDLGFPLKVCVRRRAIESVVANPACPSEAAAERAVNEVWESCFNDTRPFDEVPSHANFFFFFLPTQH